jgi:hypothetical protein
VAKVDRYPSEAGVRCHFHCAPVIVIEVFCPISLVEGEFQIRETRCVEYRAGQQVIKIPGVIVPGQFLSEPP